MEKRSVVNRSKGVEETEVKVLRKQEKRWLVNRRIGG